MSWGGGAGLVLQSHAGGTRDLGVYVQLGDVRTHYEVDGAGEPLVLLPPGGADSRAFETNLPGLVVSPDGPGAFHALSAKLDRMHQVEPTLVLMGDDEEVSYEHIVVLRTGLPDAQLAIVPGTGHGVIIDKPDLCNLMIAQFLTDDVGQLEASG